MFPKLNTTTSTPAVVIPDPAAVIPDLIRDPVPRRHWIAGQARNDSRRPQYHARNDKQALAVSQRLGLPLQAVRGQMSQRSGGTDAWAAQAGRGARGAGLVERSAGFGAQNGQTLDLSLIHI